MKKIEGTIFKLILVMPEELQTLDKTDDRKRNHGYGFDQFE